MKICVYCASSSKIDPVYFEAAEQLAEELVKSKVQVVFGGGGKGLMGQVADTVLKHEGSIKGIMPTFMKEVEWGHPEVEDFVYTETMHERKAKLLEGVDGLIALPGGCGTLEELMEAITLKRLGLYTNPIVILNTKGFYNPLREMLERCVEENFMQPVHLKMWNFVDSPQDVLPAMKSAAPWSKDAINFASQE